MGVTCEGVERGVDRVHGEGWDGVNSARGEEACDGEGSVGLGGGESVRGAGGDLLILCSGVD